MSAFNCFQNYIGKESQNKFDIKENGAFIVFADVDRKKYL